MRSVWYVFRQQFINIGTIFRIAMYEKKASYQTFYFGRLWELLSPLLQILVYYLIFGVYNHRESMTENKIPYIIWLLTGIIPWFYISSNIVQGANSIYAQLALISKTNFSSTILPSVTLIRNLPNFIVMELMLFCIMYFSGMIVLINYLSLLYYTVSMISFLFAFSLLNATITILFRDYKLIIASSMRLLVFISGVVVQLQLNSERLLSKVFKLNPLFYLIEGFRKSMLSIPTESNPVVAGIYFWSLTGLIFMIGAIVHIKYKDDYINYI